MTDAHADPTDAVVQVVDTVRGDFAQVLVHEVVDPDIVGTSSGAPFSAPILKSPTSSFFFVSTDTTGRFPFKKAVA